MIFQVDERDVPWLHEVATRRGAAEIEWDGIVVCDLPRQTTGSGYFVARTFTDEATAKRIAAEILEVHGPGNSPSPGAAHDGGRKMSQLSEDVLHEGITLDLMFRKERPGFGDLFTICGFKNPSFPPKSTMFAGLGGLGFEQVDEFFGIKSESDVGDDIAVWLMPLINGKVVWHEQGPFDGVRLEFNVLRHPANRASKFVAVVERLVSELAVDVRDGATGAKVDQRSLLAQLNGDIRSIQDHWQRQGVRCGSAEALAIDW